MKSIIVPVDFSSQSEYAFQVAASIAKKQNATIYVLHMLELNQAIVSSNIELHPEQMVFFIKLAEKRLSEFMDKPYLKGVKLVPIIKHFKVFSEISEVAQEHSADLIVMGSHGTEGLKEIFVGSNTERVVRNSDIPVLVIKNRIEDFKPRKMVFACDLKEENINAFHRAESIADIFSAKLKPVYINTPGDDFMATSEIRKKMDAFSRAVDSDLSITIYNDYSIERGVLNYAEESKADVIGIPTHGRKGLSHFFMGSIGEDVANHSEIPVITFKI
jgi:nucleotide-binding universal stress UspA family protein